MNYIELLKKSWKELEDCARDEKKFDPKTEDDIKCFLYHCLLKNQRTAIGIHSEEPYD